MKVYVVGTYLGYTRWIDNCQLVDKIEDAQVVFFTGGGDVSPKYYGCKQHPRTWPSTFRDEEEIKIFKQIRSNQVVWGTCRGFQLLCVMNGGKLIQDVTGHAGSDHEITNGKDTYHVTSIHHQMIYPWDLNPKDYDILFWSEHRISRYYEGDQIDSNKVIVEPEMAIFHKEGLPFCFGVQGHPEMMLRSDPFVRRLNKMLLEYVERICK